MRFEIWSTRFRAKGSYLLTRLAGKAGIFAKIEKNGWTGSRLLGGRKALSP